MFKFFVHHADHFLSVSFETDSELVRAKGGLSIGHLYPQLLPQRMRYSLLRVHFQAIALLMASIPDPDAHVEFNEGRRVTESGRGKDI
jgi:hypothetical protein